MGQAILVILFLGSISTWTIIIQKICLLRQVRRGADEFLHRFNRVKQGIFSLSPPRTNGEDNPFYRVYLDGCRQIEELESGNPDSVVGDTGRWERMEETLQRTGDARIAGLHRNLIFLATAASTGPLLGILGTVYGVLIAFQGMGRYGSATIDAVAPGISQALNTTVFGLIVAIPALISYNYFCHAIERLSGRMDNFIWSFLEAARRQYGHQPQPRPGVKKSSS